MTTRRSLKRLVLVLAAIATVAAFTTTALAAKKEDKGARLHIDAEFSSYLAFEGNARCQPPLLLVIGIGTAKGTHLSSHSAATAEECSDAESEPGKFHVHGIGTFTAPNGDTLYLDYLETSNAPVFDPVTGACISCVLIDEGTFTVVGGTGRFAGATGGGSISAVVPIYYDFTDPIHPLKAHVTAEYDGTIQFSEKDDKELQKNDKDGKDEHGKDDKNAKDKNAKDDKQDRSKDPHR
jgi:hypothetical protein